MTVGLVFQGPLRSRDFACGPLLVSYAERLAAASVRAVCCLSTWDEETIPPEVCALPWLLVQSKKPPGFDLMNRQKQLFSTLRGAEAILAQEPVDFLLKIRADLELPLEPLLRDIAACPPGRLLFPAASSVLPFYLNDFFFGGPPALLLDFLKVNLSFGDAFLRYAPEMDFALKYLFVRHRADLAPLSDRRCFLNPLDVPYLWSTGVQAVAERVWRASREKHFALCSERVLGEALWRGKPVRAQYGILGAEFGAFEPAGDFGSELKPLRPMPARLKFFHWLRSLLEYVRWRVAGLRWLHVADHVFKRIHAWIKPPAHA